MFDSEARGSAASEAGVPKAKRYKLDPDKRYEHKESSRDGTKRQAAYKWLRTLHKKHGHIPSTKELVAEARNPKSPGHALFDWDRDRALERDLIRQANGLIDMYRYVLLTKDSRGKQVKVASVAEFIGVERGGDRHDRVDVVSDAERRKLRVARHIQQQVSWCEETADYPELAAFRAAVLDALEEYVSKAAA